MLLTIFQILLFSFQLAITCIQNIGAAVILFIAICIIAHNTKEIALFLKSLFQHAMGYFFPMDLTKLPYGKWAVITGATEGIGAAYARAFAKRGMNLLILSRTVSKLEKMADEIRREYGVEVEFLSVDFSGNAMNYVPSLRKILHKTRINSVDKAPIAESIGVLVNNVGMLPYAYDTLVNDIMRRKEENPDRIYAEGMQAALNTNCASQMVMTSELINLIRNKPTVRGNNSGIKGVIISLSSYTAKRPMPFWVTYTACKAFNYRVVLLKCRVLG